MVESAELRKAFVEELSLNVGEPLGRELLHDAPKAREVHAVRLSLAEAQERGRGLKPTPTG